MPQSKKRHHHHSQQHPSTQQSASKKRSSVITITVIFFTLIGLGIGFFAGEDNYIVLIAGIIIGAACGYFFGRQIDRSISNK